jgi:hypothetical protein
VTAPGRRGYGLDLNIDYTDSSDMHRGSNSGGGHMTDGTGLPRSPFSADGINVLHVFGNSFGACMGEDEVYCALLLLEHLLVCKRLNIFLSAKVIGAKILSDMIHRGPNVEPVISDEEEDEEVEEKEEAKLIDVKTGITSKKKKKKIVGTCGLKKKTLEDECLIGAWKAMVGSGALAPLCTPAKYED